MFIGSSQTYTPGQRPLQRPFDVAVVIPTILRGTLLRAVK